MSKKMKRYDGEDGSLVGTETAQGKNEAIKDDVRMRALKAVSEGGQKEETAPVPKKAAAKITPKAESKNESPNPSATKEDPAMVAKAYQEAAKMQAPKSEAPAAKEEPKASSLPRSQAKAASSASSFIEKSKAQIGQEAKDQTAKYEATKASMKESGANMSPRMKAARASNPSTNMRSGGKVSSASRRADGIAIRGKTRA